MQTESFGKMLPQILIPFARQWADRSGIQVLSKLLVDDQFLELIAKYADELTSSLSQFGAAPVNGNGHSSGQNNGYSKGHSNGHSKAHRPQTQPDADLATLNERVLAMEAKQQAQQALVEVLRTKIRPLALALGCCPDCIVGVEGCPKCLGRSKVGQFQPDQALLRALVVNPLIARGVPLNLSETKESRPVQQPENHSATKKRRASHAGRNGRKLGS
jgi:hypothetical protein